MRFPGRGRAREQSEIFAARGELKLARHLKLFFHLLILRPQFAGALLNLGLEMGIEREEFGLSKVARSFSAIDSSANQNGNLRNN